MNCNFIKKTALVFLFITGFIQASLVLAQGSYAVLGDSPENSVASETSLLGDLDNRLVYLNVVAGDNKLWVSDATPDGTFQIGTPEQEDIRLIAKTDDAWYFEEIIGDLHHISVLEAGSDELVSLFSIDEDIARALYWNGDIYFTVDSETSFAGDDLMKLTPATGEAEILFISDFGGIRGLGATSTDVMFIASMDEGKMLGKTDGTLANTSTFHMLYEAGSEFASQVFMQSDGEKMFFGYHPNNNPFNLWVSDGSSEGTMILNSYDHPSFGQPTQPFVFLDGNFYFILRDDNSPSGTTYQLHVSDGTVAGTLNLNPFSSGYLHPRKLTIFNDKVYFNSLRSNWSLMATDGTIIGTETVISAYGYQTGGIGGVYENSLYQDSLVVQAYSNDFGAELYISDGTLEGTRLLSDVWPGEEDSYPKQMTQVGDLLFFLAESANGTLLWVYDRNFNPFACTDFVLDSVAVTNVSGNNLGSIEVMVSGGLEPYTYQIGSEVSSSSPVFENLIDSTYQLTITDANDCEIVTEVTVETITNILNTSLVTSFVAYPNPVVAGVLNLNLSFADDLEALAIEVYDLSGRLVFQQEDRPVFGPDFQQQLDISDLSQGEYILRITTKKQLLVVDKFSVVK